LVNFKERERICAPLDGGRASPGRSTRDTWTRNRGDDNRGLCLSPPPSLKGWHLDPGDTLVVTKTFKVTRTPPGGQVLAERVMNGVQGHVKVNVFNPIVWT
jgi:hypothetical protein